MAPLRAGRRLAQHAEYWRTDEAVERVRVLRLPGDEERRGRETVRQLDGDDLLEHRHVDIVRRMAPKGGR